MGDLTAVIFDVDGTLVDSERDGHRVAFNLAFEEFDLPDRWDVETYGELLAITGGKNRLEAWFSDQGMPAEERRDLVPRLHARKTELFQELVAEGKFEPRPGMVRLLDELDAAGVPLAVATTGSREWVDGLLERLFGADRFRFMVAGHEAPERKPDPSAFTMVLERLDVAPESAVAIEDSESGLQAAKSAGMPCVVVVNDYTRDHDFAAADLVLDGAGDPGHPAEVLHDPHGLKPPGHLTVDILRRLV